MSKKKNSVVLFHEKQVRRHWDDKKELWYFSVVDVVKILTNSSIPKRYWTDLKSKLKSEGSEVYEKIVQLKLTASDGKKYATDCANTETMLRVIQSIPSPKAEPLKLWLSKVGYERIQEIENPELAQERMKVLYEKKGYSKSWIDKRLRGIAVRQDLTDEWQERGAKENPEYAILTNEIIQGTFGMKVDEYKEFKKLNRENLRDHMTDLELILTMLGEATTTKITKSRNSQGLNRLQKDAQDGGRITGKARKNIEIESGEKVVSEKNYLKTAESQQRLAKK